MRPVVIVESIASECLPDGKEDLEVSRVLLDTLAWVRSRLPWLSWSTGQQVVDGSLEADKAGRIDGVCQVDAHRTNRRFVAHAKPDCVHHIVEILEISLA